MNLTRREFAKSSLTYLLSAANRASGGYRSALGFLALPGTPMFAAPDGWKAKDGRTVEKLLVVGNHHQFRSSLKELPNAVSFFGHWHCSNADWKTIYYDGWSFPEIC